MYTDEKMKARTDTKILSSLNLRQILIRRNFNLTCSQVGKLTGHFLFRVRYFLRDTTVFLRLYPGILNIFA